MKSSQPGKLSLAAYRDKFLVSIIAIIKSRKSAHFLIETILGIIIRNKEERRNQWPVAQRQKYYLDNNYMTESLSLNCFLKSIPRANAQTPGCLVISVCFRYTCSPVD